MRRSPLFVSLALSLLLGSFASAQTCVRTDIMVQGGTIVTGNINRYGTVVGYFHPADPNAPQIAGFRWNNGVFNTYQYPGAKETQFTASNDKGQIAGFYNIIVGIDRYPHGFLYENGTFTQIDYPGATTTTLAGINNAGDLVGTFTVTPTGWHPHAFIKHGSTWTEIVPPSGGHDTVPTAISNSGEVVGYYGTDTGGFNFLYKNGQATNFSPKAGTTWSGYSEGINNYESIVGFSTGAAAFTYKHGNYYAYYYPKSKGASYAGYTGINDLGDRVGLAYLKSGGTQGFVMKCR